MVTVHEAPNCGNSPRTKILRDLVVALAEQNTEFVDSFITDEIAWTLVGERTVTGRATVHAWVAALPPVDEVTFGTFLTHGRGAGVDGVLLYADGTRHAFCHVVRFAGAVKTSKIIGVNSYIITPADASSSDET